jgi:hypothetical protein
MLRIPTCPSRSWAWRSALNVGFCTGRGGVTTDHCCYLYGEVCRYLVDNQTPGPGRYRCGLRLELGSWDAVEADPRYESIARHFGSLTACRDFQPEPNTCCREVRDGDMG